MHDVDRYRGSCLIASKPRGGRGHPRGRAPPQDSNQSQQQMSSASLDNATTGYLLEGGSALAGMPLFSLLPQRRGSLRHPRPHVHLNHHHSHHSHHTHHNTHHQQQHQQHQQQQHHHRVHRSVSLQSPPEGGVNSESGPGRGQEAIDEVERLPLARLALHTQGAPLVLATCSPQRHTPLCPTPQQGREVTDGEGSVPAASDAVSVTSDEGSTGHDNCLPRIIKPRKRRKKDRKPTGGSSPPGSVEGGVRGEGDVDGDGGGTIVTLKPYLPMCYNYQCRGHHDQSEPRRCQISRTCSCGTCVPAHVFPTPPPSPASSSSSSSSSVLCNMSSASSSCSSSEDEPTAGITNSFAGHRDLDIRIGGYPGRELGPRTRHYSVPPPAARPALPRGGQHYYLPGEFGIECWLVGGEGETDQTK
ncbi:hypothetical protein Pcinc_029285 [Petrolisthes cinctipes]|uniref:Uncharacterized protein n=1 Tax=Petrolisthes cinctipes TaxID=88211 RepID=A0AAE1F0D9_PETCI|nr:hypothetical protein Pcinc_029285 [Petrolisthes cinctipes]